MTTAVTRKSERRKKRSAIEVGFGGGGGVGALVGVRDLRGSASGGTGPGKGPGKGTMAPGLRGGGHQQRRDGRALGEEE